MGFALRLARAETFAAGGSFEHREDRLHVTLPRQMADTAAGGSVGGDGSAA